MYFRKALSSLLASMVAVASIPLGCGGVAQEEGPGVVLRQQELPRMAEGGSVEVPDATVREIKACVDARADRWPEPSYTFQYDMRATDRGDVVGVKLHDATLRDASLEACFERALAAMNVPKDALQLRVVKPFSGGESTYSSRTSAGFVQALAAPIALAPIFIPALGVTIIVAISLDIIRKATSGPNCKQVKAECITFCSDTTLPTPDFGWKFQKCKNDCLESQGCPRDS
jgi:hypothetical protein